MKSKKITYTLLILFAAIIISIPVITEILVFDRPAYTGTSKENIRFDIQRGATMSQIASILNNKGFKISENELKLVSKWLEMDGKIRHGEFNYDPSLELSVKELVGFLTKGGHRTVNITIPEGSRIIDIARILNRKMGIDSVLFVQKTTDPDLVSMYGIPANSFEGYLYPETYNFNEQDTADDIIDRMVATNRAKISLVKSSIDSSRLSEHDILTLASIIQGEVMDYKEIYKISAVYNNRLKKNMLLQADPTIQYLFEKPKRLLNKDIAIDSPYNTYLHKGLPPGPVNNPSIRSVVAALKPVDVPYIYMVAKGDGTHYFNTDFQSHLQDKQKFDVIRRMNKNKK
ncbi:MAG: endolytic transglycosylase MltG [Candidatus Delongbacteria bacterium]